MHLVEAYAMAARAKIEKCFIEEEPIKLPTKPYITLHSHNPKGSGRQYRYWDNVIQKLLDDKLIDYDIIQIGGALDTRTIANSYYLGKTNYNSLAYLMKYSQLHIGFDSFPVHLASHYDKKMVVLYAHYAYNSRPYFSTPDNVIVLEPDHSIIKPVFDHSDEYDQINSIDYNKVVGSVYKLLL